MLKHQVSIIISIIFMLMWKVWICNKVIQNNVLLKTKTWNLSLFSFNWWRDIGSDFFFAYFGFSVCCSSISVYDFLVGGVWFSIVVVWLIVVVISAVFIVAKRNKYHYAWWRKKRDKGYKCDKLFCISECTVMKKKLPCSIPFSMWDFWIFE